MAQVSLDSTGINFNGTIQTTAGTDLGQLISVTSFTANGTYTVPAGATKVLVQLVGGGGGASGYGESGGGGGYSEGMFSIAAGTNVSVTVGGGGAGIAYNNVGTQGGTTSFGAYLSATGGYGANSYLNHAGGHGGLGTGGQTNLYGGVGTGHMNYGSHAQDARGGSTYFGGPGGKIRSNTTDNFSPSPGSGASGGIGEIGSNGAAGAAGLVVVYAYK